MKYRFGSISLFLVSIFFIVYACSDDSNEEEANNQDTFFSLSSDVQHEYWLNTNNLCSVGWNIHPYKKCGLESFGVKSYKEDRTEACGVEYEVQECKSCRNPKFGGEKVNTIHTKNIIRSFKPVVINIFAPNNLEQVFDIESRSPVRRNPLSDGFNIEGYYKIKGIKPLNYNHLPNINDNCISHISEIKNEFNSLFPEKIVEVNFTSGNFNLPSGEVMQNSMLHDMRMKIINAIMKQTKFGYNWNSVVYHIHYQLSNNGGIEKTITPFCNYTVEIKEHVYKEVKNCDICGIASYDKSYKRCRHPSHGVEEYNTKKSIECGTDESQIIKSTRNLSKDQVEQNEGEVLECSTCDNISFDSLYMDKEENQNAVKQRRDCLTNNLNNLSEDDESTKLFITRELTRLKTYFDVE